MALRITEVDVAPDEPALAGVDAASEESRTSGRMTRRNFLRATLVGGALAVAMRFLPPLPGYSRTQVAHAGECSNNCVCWWYHHSSCEWFSLWCGPCPDRLDYYDVWAEFDAPWGCDCVDYCGRTWNLNGCCPEGCI